ncbi:MAG: alpha/beta hydrolase [Victivallales bacterium]|jgi:acetyl esterase/lipase|nr:alpha/beta hydrolase [Victivallales bacterium]
MDYAWNEKPAPSPVHYRHWRDIPYAEGDDDPMRTLWLSCPQEREGFATVVWFHGGGFAQDGHECPPVLYNGQYAVVEPRYRLSPQVKAPAYHQDGAAAIGWVLTNIASYGGDPQKVFVGGMSAGGYLAAIVAMDPSWLAPYGHAPQDVAGLLLTSGQMTTHFQVKADMGDPRSRFQPVVDPLAPLAHLSPDLPPILLVTGDPACDIPARAEENALMAASLRAMGHPCVEHHQLSGHDHGGAFRSCDFLIERFLDKILADG